jgi:hypothetical protein
MPTCLVEAQVIPSGDKPRQKISMFHTAILAFVYMSPRTTPSGKMLEMLYTEINNAERDAGADVHAGGAVPERVEWDIQDNGMKELAIIQKETERLQALLNQRNQNGPPGVDAVEIPRAVEIPET